MSLTLDEARAFHAEFPVIDLHADTPKLMDKLGYDLGARHERPMPKPFNMLGHVDRPLLRQVADGDVGDLEAQARARLDGVGLLRDEPDERAADVAAAQQPDPHHLRHAR